MSSISSTGVSTDSSTLLSTTVRASAAVSVLTTTNSWTWVPSFETSKVTEPAAALVVAGATLHSVRLTAMDPAGGASADGADDVPAEPQPTMIAPSAAAATMEPDLDRGRMAHLPNSERPASAPDDAPVYPGSVAGPSHGKARSPHDGSTPQSPKYSLSLGVSVNWTRSVPSTAIVYMSAFEAPARAIWKSSLVPSGENCGKPT